MLMWTSRVDSEAGILGTEGGLLYSLSYFWPWGVYSGVLSDVSIGVGMTSGASAIGGDGVPMEMEECSRYISWHVRELRL